MIEREIDYIQASLWLSESKVIMEGWKPLSPVKFYKRGYLHPRGWRYYFGNPNSKKAMVIASGETMRSLRNDGWEDAAILEKLLSEGTEISRLDLAVTEWLEDDLVTLEDMETWYAQELVDSSLVAGGLKKITTVFHGGGNQVETLYIGRMQKRGQNGIFRMYDKGIELNIGAYLSSRLELELKRESAQNTAKRMAQTGDLSGNFRAKFNVRSQGFDRLMDAPAAKITRGAAKQSEDENETSKRRWDWLIKQVAPALKQAIKDEREAGRGDGRLTHFLREAGLQQEMIDASIAYALHVEYDKFVTKTKVSSLDFD